MSIATEIQRLKQAKADIKTAIENKGVEVGDGLIDTYAEKIVSIESGDNEYDKFWDSFQRNGNRVNYEYGFGGEGWNDETFKPKYDIKPTQSTYMFSNCGITDMITALKNAGVTFDFSQVKDTSYLAFNSSITRFPTIDTSSRPNINHFFMGNKNLEYIEKVILKSDGSQTFNDYSFKDNPKLKEIRFEGVIGKSGFNIKDSTLLSKASITSIINALSTTTSGLTVTLSQTAVNNAFETSTGSADGSTSQEWLNLKATKSNWTISLV